MPFTICKVQFLTNYSVPSFYRKKKILATEFEFVYVITTFPLNCFFWTQNSHNSRPCCTSVWMHNLKFKYWLESTIYPLISSDKWMTLLKVTRSKLGLCMVMILVYSIRNTMNMKVFVCFYIWVRWPGLWSVYPGDTRLARFYPQGNFGTLKLGLISEKKVIYKFQFNKQCH